jgi:hypothetical protein
LWNPQCKKLPSKTTIDAETRKHDIGESFGPGLSYWLWCETRDMGAPASEIEAALLTVGFDRPYAFGLSMALISKGVKLDVIGSKELDSPEMHAVSKLTFLNLHGDQRQTVAVARKLSRHLILYGRLICYAATAKPRIFHILWNNEFQLFDRTLLMLSTSC